MAPRAFIVTRLGVASLARWGFAAGALIACIPALACGAVAFSLVAAIHRTLEGWRSVGVGILGQQLSLDFIKLLHLESLVSLLRTLDTFCVLGILLFWFLLSALLGSIVGLALALLGIFYNLTGRLELELREK